MKISEIHPDDAFYGSCLVPLLIGRTGRFLHEGEENPSFCLSIGHTVNERDNTHAGLFIFDEPLYYEVKGAVRSIKYLNFYKIFVE